MIKVFGIALYMPVVAKFISFNKDGRRKCIAMWVVREKITIKFLKDSVKETKVTSHNGKNKSAVEIPGRMINHI